MAMPKALRRNGPWGEAINYWLDQRGWNQTDLRKAIRQRNASVSKNTIGNAARGFDVSTRVLGIIATALDVSLEAVLVSPNRRSAQEERKQMILEITERVARQLDFPAPQAPNPLPTAEQEPAHRTYEQINADLNTWVEDEEQKEQRRVAAAKARAERAARRKRKPKSNNPKRKRGGDTK